MLKFRNI